MSETLSEWLEHAMALTLSGVAGLALGAVFFGGLWWTLRKSLESPRPALWLLGSLLVRMSLVLVGLYLISGGQWERLLSGLAGVIGARFLVLRLTSPADRPSDGREGDRHAPDSR